MDAETALIALVRLRRYSEGADRVPTPEEVAVAVAVLDQQGAKILAAEREAAATVHREYAEWLRVRAGDSKMNVAANAALNDVATIAEANVSRGAEWATSTTGGADG